MSVEVGRVNHIQPRRLLAMALAVAWAAQIFCFSTEGFASERTSSSLVWLLRLLHVGISPAGVDLLNLAIRKLAHVVEYAILAVLLYCMFLSGDRFKWQARLARRCIVGAAAYAITDEFHQLFVRGRGASIRDCLIDVTGAAAGMLVVYLCSRTLPPSQSDDGLPLPTGGDRRALSAQSRLRVPE